MNGVEVEKKWLDSIKIAEFHSRNILFMVSLEQFCQSQVFFLQMTAIFVSLPLRVVSWFKASQINRSINEADRVVIAIDLAHALAVIKISLLISSSKVTLLITHAIYRKLLYIFFIHFIHLNIIKRSKEYFAGSLSPPQWKKKLAFFASLLSQSTAKDKKKTPTKKGNFLHQLLI